MKRYNEREEACLFRVNSYLICFRIFFFSSAKLMSFPEICGLLYPPANELAVLKCVQQHAVLVQGCWIVKRLAAVSTHTQDL